MQLIDWLQVVQYNISWWGWDPQSGNCVQAAASSATTAKTMWDACRTQDISKDRGSVQWARWQYHGKTYKYSQKSFNIDRYRIWCLSCDPLSYHLYPLSLVPLSLASTLTCRFILMSFNYIGLCIISWEVWLSFTLLLCFGKDFQLHLSCFSPRKKKDFKLWYLSFHPCFAHFIPQCLPLWQVLYQILLKGQ